jgi:hypothetical protein
LRELIHQCEVGISKIGKKSNYTEQPFGYIGKGLKKTKTKTKAKKIGRGLSPIQIISDDNHHEKKTSKRQVNTQDKNKKVFGNYFIDLKLLKSNILALKYVKNGNVVTNMGQVYLKDEVKPVIMDLINTGTYRQDEFNKLQGIDKRLLVKLGKYLKIDIDNSVDANEFQKEFQILLGERDSGNDNPLIIKKLKQYVLIALQEGMMTRSAAYQMLIELSL